MVDRPMAGLLREARSGDPEAMARVCVLFYPKVLKYMRYRVDAASAEDLTSEVFVRVLSHVAEQKGFFEAWLYRIAANVVVDHARAKTVRRETILDEETPETAGHDETHSEASDRQMDIETAMATLTDEQRELVTLKFIQGLSNAEIGEVTGRSPEGIRGLQFRALKALREVLDKDAGGKSDGQ